MSKVPVETIRIDISDENEQDAGVTKLKTSEMYYVDKENPNSDIFEWTVQEDVAFLDTISLDLDYVSYFLNVKNHYKDNAYSGLELTYLETE